MKHPGDKGSFTTEIADDVLKEALKAVEKRTGGGSTEDEKPAEAAPVDPPAAATPAAPAEPVPDLRDKEIEQLKGELEVSFGRGRDLMQKLKDEHEKMLRAVADLENYKKRALKEKEEVQKFGIEKLLKDFLPVFDNFDRALDSAKSPADYDSLRKGVEMIRKLMEDSLGKHGVKTFSAKGLPFDPQRHEAMSAAETADMPPNHVFAEILRGFTLNDRLVRPALVMVSKAPAPPPAAEPATAPESPAPAVDPAGEPEGFSPAAPAAEKNKS
ncbi:MAG: nucleotide exchange factor GrpE [Archangium sp.]|nr:nucleotide exchange factor GrpE [Archangium sp.]